MAISVLSSALLESIELLGSMIDSKDSRLDSVLLDSAVMLDSISSGFSSVKESSKSKGESGVVGAVSCDWSVSGGRGKLSSKSCETLKSPSCESMLSIWRVSSAISSLPISEALLKS